MAAENEIEELELQLESKVCGLGVDGLVELAEQLEVENIQDNKTGKQLVATLAFVDGKSPPLEQETAKGKQMKVKDELLTNQKRQMRNHQEQKKGKC